MEFHAWIFEDSNDLEKDIYNRRFLSFVCIIKLRLIIVFKFLWPRKVFGAIVKLIIKNLNKN